MKNTRGLLALGIALVGITVPAMPYAHTNFGFAYDSYLWQPPAAQIKNEVKKVTSEGVEKVCVETKDRYKVNYGISMEYGFDMQGLDKDGETVEPLRIFGPSESAIAMFNEEPAGSALNFITGLTTPLSLTDDDIRGRVTLDGKRKETDVNIWLSAALPWESVPGRWELGIYIPLKMVETTDVAWVNVPNPNNLPIGQLHTQLTDVLDHVTDVYGDGLRVDDLKDHGLGDITCMLSWNEEYDQLEDGLSTVGLWARAGVAIPTSNRRDVDHALSIPLGNDGAWAIPLAGGMNLYFENKLRLGAAADINVLFNETGQRRLRTSACQTELLLSQEVEATRKAGTQLRITAIAEGHKIAEVFTAGVSYQGSWRSEDEFSVDHSRWDDSLTGPINTSERYQESVYHQLIFRAGFDWSDEYGCKHGPRINAFFKYPLKRGKRTAIYKTFGAEISFNF
ncbi:hypothetical protein KAU11_01920 [Candidatus Babeliales bacterium]|nr:hypothetical protein [Candidatus Babeliales bacterium]